jgi:hypothetical protein
MPPPAPAHHGPDPPRQPWELVDEIMNLLKTSFPLLNLTMEKMVDQISVRAKPASDEDIYRFFSALLADSLQVSRCVVALTTAMVRARVQSGRCRGQPVDAGEYGQVFDQSAGRNEGGC